MCAGNLKIWVLGPSGIELLKASTVSFRGLGGLHPTGMVRCLFEASPKGPTSLTVGCLGFQVLGTVILVLGRYLVVGYLGPWGSLGVIWPRESASSKHELSPTYRMSKAIAAIA